MTGTRPGDTGGGLLRKDNNLSHLNVDQYFVPTGVPVPDLPREFVLYPGERMVLSFGSVTPDTYLLAIAEGVGPDILDVPHLLFAASPVTERTPADVNRDGHVDNLDIRPLVAHLAGGGAPVPVPATGGLLALGGLVLIRRRRRCFR